MSKDPSQLNKDKTPDDRKTANAEVTASKQTTRESQLNSMLDEIVTSGSLPKERDWSDVIPGIDAETKAMYEKWDEIYSGNFEVPIVDLLQQRSNYKFPNVESITSDEEADPLLDELLDKLDELQISINFCDHVTPVTALKLLVTKMLPEATVHPDMASTGIRHHYDTWHVCSECAAEMEADFD